jgi:AraC-like DNA-binding protein
MRGSVTSTFSEPEEFRAAMSADRSISFLFTESGRFRARSTEVRLDHLRLVSVEESLSCIAFIRVPPGIILIGLSIEYAGSLTWGGTAGDSRELVTLGAGQCVHMRSAGPCHWGAIWLPVQEFTRYSGALTGTAMDVPPSVCRWRPHASAAIEFRSLYMGAIRTAQVRAAPATGTEAAHGLEQQLIHLLVECLSAQPALMAPANQRSLELMARFEELIRDQPEGSFSATRISAALGVSDRFLRKCCAEHLGTSPMGYVRLHRMQLGAVGAATYPNAIWSPGRG